MKTYWKKAAEITYIIVSSGVGAEEKGDGGACEQIFEDGFCYTTSSLTSDWSVLTNNIWLCSADDSCKSV